MASFNESIFANEELWEFKTSEFVAELEVFEFCTWLLDMTGEWGVLEPLVTKLDWPYLENLSFFFKNEGIHEGKDSYLI